MDVESKTPVDIIQEIIAVLTTRKELAEKLSPVLKNDFASVEKQTDEFHAALLEELSQFGDGTNGISDRENTYQKMYKNLLPSLENMPEAEAHDTFVRMEDELIKIYVATLETPDTLPESLVKVLTDQQQHLKA